MMKQHAIAAAVFAACGIGMSAPVLADVQIYGTLLEFVSNYRTSGATSSAPANGASQVKNYTGVTVGSQNRTDSGTSNLGFRGTEDLGDGLKALWQLESQVFLDGGGTSTFGTRNSRLGLSSQQWGTVFAGNWDSPYKSAFIDVAGTTIALFPFDNNITGSPGFGVFTTTKATRANAAADASFNRRQGNSVQYWSPTIAGFSLRTDYSFGETSTSTGAKPSLWAASLRYDHDGLSLRYAYERHNDYFGLSQLGGSEGATASNTSSKDDAHLLAVSYQFPSATRVGLVFDHLSYHNDDTAAGAVSDYKRNGLVAFVKQSFGQHAVWGMIGKAKANSCSVVGGASCSTDGLGATQYAFGYEYDLSKRTQLHAAYYGIRNEASASYVLTGAATGSATPGADSRALGVGMLHTF